MTVLSDKEIAAVGRSAGFTGNDLVTFVAVALAESRGDTDAVSPTGDYGLMQINRAANGDVIKNGDWRNPFDNARMAMVIKKRQGWKAWTTYPIKSGAFQGRALAAYGQVLTVKTVAGIPLPIPGLPFPSWPKVPLPNDIPGTDITAPWTVIGDFLDKISDPIFHLRVGMFIVGGILIMIALFKMTGDNQVSDTTKAVVKMAVLRKAPVKK